METLKSKLKVVWAVAAAVVILLGGIGVKDALASHGTITGYSDPYCKNRVVIAWNMSVITTLANAGQVMSFRVNAGKCMAIIPVGS